MKKIIFISTIIIAIIVSVFFIFNSSEYKNELSKRDTFDRFIMLVEKGEYEEAKKLTTKNFNGDFSLIKRLKISQMTEDTSSNDLTECVFTETEQIGYYKSITKYIFKLVKTDNGWKVDNFDMDITDNEDEVKSLIY